MVDKKQKLVEITRSFTYKLNCGNYQMADFFCSQKAEVPEDEAEKISEQLYEFCKSEVIKSVNAYKKLMPKPEKPLTFKEKETIRQAKEDELKNLDDERKLKEEVSFPKLDEVGNEL